MKNTIQIDNLSIIYNIRKNRLSKKLRIIIHSDGRVVISAPMRVSQKNIINFLIEKKDWIKKILSECKPVNSQKIKEDKKNYIINKANALRLARQKINFFIASYNVKPKKIFIRNQSTRWGSCSSKKNLSFNFRLIYLPEQLVDYIIVHELCHLIEMNHSARFWSLVEKTIPDYKKRKTALRKTGRLLF